MFGIRKRIREAEARKAAALEQMKAARAELMQTRKEIIDSFLERKREEMYAEAKKLHDADRERVHEKNLVCPVCGSKNRINKFVRVKGKLNGHSSRHVYGSSGLFGGYYSGGSSENVHGELDTLKVNECKDCGNQWEIEEPAHHCVSDYGDDLYSVNSLSNLGRLYRTLSQTFEGDRKAERNWITGQYEGTPKAVLEYLLYLYHFSWDGYGDEDDTNFYGVPICRNENDPKYNADAYLFQFTDEAWNVIQKVIGDIKEAQ